MKIAIEIRSCKECPHFETANHWSSDGWDRMEDWVCNIHPENKMRVLNDKGETTSEDRPGKLIAACVEWREESRIIIPSWCPAKV